MSSVPSTWRGSSGRNAVVLTLGLLGIVGFVASFVGVAAGILDQATYLVGASVAVTMSVASLAVGHLGRRR